MDQRDALEALVRSLPKGLARMLLQQPEGSVREIRIRSGQRIMIHTSSGVKPCPLEPTPQQVQQMAEALCEHALYARAEEQRSGFVTLRGGHRMGLCGRVILQGQTGRTRSTLIVGLPGSGKTTMLRDACRRLSEAGQRVGIVDERSEIAAMSGGEPQLQVGPNTDVLDGCCPAAGLRWLLRSMSPDVLATDELGGIGDAQALEEAAAAGVSVLSTLHGRCLQPAPTRGLLAHLLLHRVFERYVLLDEAEVGKPAAVFDEQLAPLALP